MATQTTYSTFSITALGNIFSVLVCKGQFNYVSVRKETNNPYKSAGKQFNSFDEAVLAYKSPDMKVALLQIETGVIAPTSVSTH